MIDKFLKNGNFKLLKNAIDEGYNCSVFGLNIGEKLALLDNSAFLFYVVDNLDNASIVLEKFADMGRKAILFQDIITPLSSEFENINKFIETLDDIKSGVVDTVVLTPEVLAAKFPNPSKIMKDTISIGQELNVYKFTKKLIASGYKRVDLVSNKGEFSVRGDTIDIYSFNGEPTRIMTDFDIVESIRKYNPVSLLTTENLESCNILYATLIDITEQDIEKKYLANKIKKDDLYHDLCEFKESDYRLLAFDDNYGYSIFDYVDGGLIAFDGAKAIYDSVDKYIVDYNKRVETSVLKKFRYFINLDIKKTLSFGNNFTLVAFHFIQQNNRIFTPQKVFSIRTLPSVNYSGQKNALILDLQNFRKQNYTIILCAGNNEGVARISTLLKDNNISYNECSRLSLGEFGAINLVSRKYPLDIILPEERLAIISTDSLVGKTRKVINASVSFFDGDTPSDGDLVVHNFHGIGKCLGVKSLKISDNIRDYVIIEYKGGDKVYLPVENLNQLSRYIGSDKTPQINKIGGVEFAKAKSRIKSAVKKIAFDLIVLYRERMNIKGIKYNKDDEMQVDFEKSFGFTETVDQMKAVNECKSDMEQGKVMDRLVCGDVGFGKTEVALRIAFKTILNGKQVAILCPTTILSEQHFNTAKTRMSPFGVKIDVLNRLRNKKDEVRIKKDFADGKIDLICGTHKLLASDINYKNLGLLILDEEQKFGVSDKEKIKNLKKQINVLTLSATPIPRTLNMSLIGVRDISVIETPPIQRIPTEVQVLQYDENIIKVAIERELARNGQVLVIYNKVEKIHTIASKIRMLSPENVAVSIAHGQMSSEELEKEILDLYSGKTQILVATTLIENGVDLPNANTLIVLNADTLGLSQLYQLKGRIGRSNRSSYAYFTFDNRKILNETAYKRLQAIKEFSEMGSGFKIAMRDLEIRGAGSLLGAEQSGHIEKLGYNMYVELLNEAVKELRGEEVKNRTDIKVESNIPAFLSHEYVPSSSTRMSLYREISNIDTMLKYETFINNTTNIFGDLPEELINLCKIALIKNRLSYLGVEKLIIKKIIKLFFASKEALNKPFIDAVVENCDNISLSITDVPIIEIKPSTDTNILDFLLDFIRVVDNF